MRGADRRREGADRFFVCPVILGSSLVSQGIVKGAHESESGVGQQAPECRNGWRGTVQKSGADVALVLNAGMIRRGAYASIPDLLRAFR